MARKNEAKSAEQSVEKIVEKETGKERGETKAAAAPKSSVRKTVMVALNRASGIQFTLPDGRKVVIAGNAAHLRGREQGILPVGAFGLTEIDADDWAWIERTYGPHMELFRNGLLFAQARKADAQDAADERAETRHGLEPVDPEASRTEPFDGKGA